MAVLLLNIAAGIGRRAVGNVDAPVAARIGAGSRSRYCCDIAAGVGTKAGGDTVGARRAAIADGDAVIAADRGRGADGHGIVPFTVLPVPMTEEPEAFAVLATVLLEPTTWMLLPLPATFGPFTVLLSPNTKLLLPLMRLGSPMA